MNNNRKFSLFLALIIAGGVFMTPLVVEGAISSFSFKEWIGSQRRKMNALFNTTTGHDHDGTDSKQLVTGSLADGSVTSAKLGDGEVSTAKLRADSVTSGKIADGEVTSGKMAGSTIGGAICDLGLASGAFGTCSNADASACDCT